MLALVWYVNWQQSSGAHVNDSNVNSDSLPNCTSCEIDGVTDGVKTCGASGSSEGHGHETVRVISSVSLNE